MKAQRRLGLAFAWSWTTAAFLIDVVVLVLISHLAAPQSVTWWVGVAFAALVTLAMVVTYRGIPIASTLARWAWDWSADMWDPSPDPAAGLDPGCTPAINHRRRFSRDVVGIREYQGQLVALIAVAEAGEALSGRHRREMVSSATLPVEVVAAALRQFDVRLGAIDIVSVRRRHASEPAHPSAPPTVDGIEHGTWLVLRMDPQRNVGAISARDSVASTLAAVAERLAHDLHGQGCTARILTGDELAEVDDAVAAGLEPTRTRPGWRHLKYFDGYATSFWVSPQDITSKTLDRLWRNDTDATVLTLRLTATANGSEVSAWVRYHSEKRLRKDMWAGLNRLTGRQLAAVRTSLPAPSARPPLVVPARALRDDEQLALRVDPSAVDAAPQHSTGPAEGSDDARRAKRVAPAV